MTSISATTSGIKHYPALQDIEQKTAIGTQGTKVGDVPAIIIDKATGLPRSQASRNPELREPSGELTRELTDGVAAFVAEKMNEPGFARGPGVLSEKAESGVSKLVDDKVKEQVEQGKPFDISSLSSPEVALLVAASLLLLAISQADNALNTRFTKVNSDLAIKGADSKRAEGWTSLAGNVAGSFAQLAVVGIGASQSLKGLRQERGALQTQGAKIEALNKESNMLSKKENLTPADRSRMSDIAVQVDVNKRALDITVVNSRISQTYGDAIMKSAQPLGGIVSGVGQYGATLEQAQQLIYQQESQVAKSTSDEAKQAHDKNVEMLQQILQIIKTMAESRNSSIGQSAGNLRA